jgi:2-methylcitrate dehydratase PrpD
MNAATGFTERLVARVTAVRWARLDPHTRAAARRHVLDSLAVIIAGADQQVSRRAAAVLAALRPPGPVPVPAGRRRFDVLDATYLAAVAGHGLELDDGYRAGSAHPGTVVVPAALAVAHQCQASGEALLAAVVAGYEAAILIAGAAHPAMRERGFHPTATSGVFGAAVAAAHLRGLDGPTLTRALGLAASSAAGLFAFVGGGADVKRLHPGHAAREGVFAVLLAEQGVAGPPGVLEGKDGFFQAFAGLEALAVEGPDWAADAYGITRCYIKPYPCCRHLHPAIDALLAVLERQALAGDEVEKVEVETYRIAASHAGVGWRDFASSQLSFPFVLATALRHRAVTLAHFQDDARGDRATTDLCARIEVRHSDAMDRRYRHQRPARVRVHARGRVFEEEVGDPLGSPVRPLDEGALQAKFLALTEPVFGTERALVLRDAWGALEDLAKVAPLLDDTTLMP